MSRFKKTMILLAGLAILISAGAPRLTDLAFAQEKESEADEQREAEYYERGRDALDDYDWEESYRWFSKAARIQGRRAAGASYWTAYSLHKLGKNTDAMKTLQALYESYSQSRWVDDARALEIELRKQKSGGIPSRGVVGDEDSDDLKLIALQSLMHADSDKAVPMLKKFLEGTHSPRLKEQALFVLVQTGEPEARDVVMNMARGDSNPELQRQALHYLSMFDDSPAVNTFLRETYFSTGDSDLKKAILQGCVASDNDDLVLEIANRETDPELRIQAIHMLGVMDATDELRNLYRTSKSEEEREAAIEAMSMSDQVDFLLEVARTENAPRLRVRAIHGLGMMDTEESGSMLLNIYSEKRDHETREAVLDAMMMQDNAMGLITIAESETDPELKKRAIERLANVDSELATEFFMKILED